MATKKTAPPRASAAKAKKPGKAPPVPIETAWQDLEATLRNTLGQNAAGQHPADLEPMHMTFEHAPDLSSLLPEDYQRFSLKSLDLYRTSIPPEEVEALRKALPECNVGFPT